MTKRNKILKKSDRKKSGENKSGEEKSGEEIRGKQSVEKNPGFQRFDPMILCSF